MPPIDDDEPASTAAGRPAWIVEASSVAVGVALWWWILAPPVSRPADLGLLLAAVPAIAAAVVVAERWRGGGGAVALALSALVCFVVLRVATGGTLVTLVGFALGLLRPAAWEGEHPLLRAVPLALLVAQPLRPSRGTAIVSALGVTAFTGIALALWRSTG